MRGFYDGHLPSLYSGERNDPIRNAGAKVLVGAISVMLATACVQTVPGVVWASNAAAELDAPSTGGGEGTQSPQSGGSDAGGSERDDPKGTDAGQGAHDPEDPGATAPDADDSDEDGPQDERVPLIADVSCVNAEHDRVVLEDGGTYASALCVELSRPVLLDEGEAKVLLFESAHDDGEHGDDSDYDEHEATELKPSRAYMEEGPQDGLDGPEASEQLANRIEFRIPEGRFERLVVCVREHDAEEAEREEFADLTFDLTGPRFEAWLNNKPLDDGTVCGEGSSVRLTMREEHPKLDEQGMPQAEVTLVRAENNSSAELGMWSVLDGSSQYELMLHGDGAPLADGTYQMRAEAVDDLGNPSGKAEWSFAVDTEAPTVLVSIPEDEVQCLRDGKLVFNKRVVASVTIADAHVSDRKTLVCGVPLKDLLSKDVEEGDETREICKGVSCGVWDMVRDPQGTDLYRADVTFAEGTYPVDDLVYAEDVVGHATRAALSFGDKPVDALVVDVCGPTVRASVSHAPSRVWSKDDGSEYAFFDTATLLEFVLDDETGIRSVHVLGSKAYTDKDLLVTDDLQRATIALREEPFDQNAKLVVTDWAGNETTWSLGHKGMERARNAYHAIDNAPLRVRGTNELLGTNGHPWMLVQDVDAPDISLSAPKSGAILNEAFDVQVHLDDRNLSYVEDFDKNQVVMSITKDGAPFATRTASDWEDGRAGTGRRCSITLAADDDHEADGVYELVARVIDPAGNESDQIRRSWTIDTVAPLLNVSFDDTKTENVAHEGRYYAKRRVARVSLAESNITAEELNRPDAPVHLEVQAKYGHDPADVDVTPWEFDESDERFVSLVTFPADGTYALGVAGQDKAGNLLVGARGTSVDDTGAFASPEFVVDSQRPQITAAYAPTMAKPHTYEGVDYFNKPVKLNVTIVDRNLDVAQATVTDTEGTQQVPEWKKAMTTDDGVVTHHASVTYVEGEPGEGRGHKQPVVAARDRAGNDSSARVPEFVVDQTAPNIERVTISKKPSTQGSKTGEDPFWFFNERDGVATVMTFEVSDEYLLDELWVTDPDGVYNVQKGDLRGQERATLTLALKDSVAEGSNRDTNYERDVTLSVRDMAGNLRTWTIDRHGSVVADHETSTANVSLYNGGVFPQALIKDTTAPHVEVGGVTEGAFYNDSQVAHVKLNEHNFEYLKRFDANRVVATVSRRDGRSQGDQSSWTIPVSQFEGERPNYAYDQPFVSDGHYNVIVRMEDFAGNPSEVAQTGEFTIDKTAPLIQVTWDNDDVRNGMYYHAQRTATVVVTEHNFDERLFSLQTTGRVTGWSHAGDDHTCKVVFANDATASAPHTLTIVGKDLAGNEAATYEAPPFCIDTQAPTVTLLRRASSKERFEADGAEEELVDASAFSQGIEPIVAFADEADLDERSIEVTLEGCRSKDERPSWLYERQSSSDERTLRVDWGNIGLEQEGTEPAYRLDADDVYTITAKAVDMAGNESEQSAVRFSINRYGSNFFVEDLDGGGAMASTAPALVPLTSAPSIVVHEVNVSGAESELSGPDGELSHMVTKEHASATVPIPRTLEAERTGYTLRSSVQASAHNLYEGWSEYVYVIQPGNFGEGSDSDFGDGGQGTYRVNVSSQDKAKNNNTTARFWGTDPARAHPAEDKEATVAFTLDEFGPQIEDVVLPEGLFVGRDFDASFRLRDEITNGDRITVLVDGEEVDVCREGSAEPLGSDATVSRQGVFNFSIPAKSVLDTRSVEILVSDYTGLDTRKASVSAEGFRVTTLVRELLVLVGALGASLVACLLLRRGRRVVS